MSKNALTIDYSNIVKANIAFSEELEIDRWYHMALVYEMEDGRYSFYLDGVVQGTLSEGINPEDQLIPMPYAGTQDSQSPKAIGGGAGGLHGWRNTLDGYLDEFRVSKAKRYDGDFTPSEYAFVDDAHTVLLLSLNGGDDGVLLFDSSSHGHSVSIKGGVTTQTEHYATSVNRCAYNE